MDAHIVPIVPYSCRPRKNQEAARKIWSLTLNNWTREERENLIEALGRLGEYVVGEEIGEEGTPHLQGALRSRSRIRFTALRKINPRIHWEPGRSWKHLREYCKKDGVYTSNVEATPDEEARAAHAARYDGVVWRDWQQGLLDVLGTSPGWRTIHWYWEPIGCVGKSYLAGYIYLNFPTLIVGGKATDVMQSLKTYRETEKKNPKVVIYDIPRHMKDFINYGLLEQIKNGVIFSGKYESNQFLIPPTHIICFANFEPDYEKLSEDRWNTVLIN